MVEVEGVMGVTLCVFFAIALAKVMTRACLLHQKNSLRDRFEAGTSYKPNSEERVLLLSINGASCVHTQ